ncbi:MAG TPA: ClpXP protease specificity-enhancing factor SspB [Alphaproteobacteria bacterium]|nr:ClpXP protease specificity-enhancing factor SspB [Alphaproteobacteria bacterium]
MDDHLRYDIMVENALRRVVFDTLKMVAEQGLPGSHHFYISFLTEYPGVQIPPYLREQYPKEMTIVLQYQYYGLVITAETLSVTLSFNNVKERLVVPLAAITTFADPSVNFALQFQTMDDEDEEDLAETPPPEAKTPVKDKKEEPEEKGVVISLDQFRKKPEEKKES